MEKMILDTTDFLNKLSDEKISKDTLDPSIIKKYVKNSNHFTFKMINDMNETYKNKLYDWMKTVDGFNKEYIEKMLKVDLKLDKRVFFSLFGNENGNIFRQVYNNRGFVFLRSLNEDEKKNFLEWAEDIINNKKHMFKEISTPEIHLKNLNRSQLDLLRMKRLQETMPKNTQPAYRHQANPVNPSVRQVGIQERNSHKNNISQRSNQGQRMNNAFNHHTNTGIRNITKDIRNVNMSDL